MNILLLSLALANSIQVASGFVQPRAAVDAGRLRFSLVSLAENASVSSFEGPGKINSLIDLDSPKVVNKESVACGKKGVYCRCWKSATFPACDGTHMKHNEATGDNVGPLIVSASVPEKDASSSSSNEESVSFGLSSLWATGGVLAILLEAFRRTLPSASEPIRAGSFSPVQWLAYSAAVVVFTYGQGQKCLSCKLAPLVVKRSSLLTENGGQRSLINVLLAPVYAMGLISANKSRLIKSHSLVWGTLALQVALHRGWVLGGGGPILNIVNGGFCAGFAWGALSLAWQYGKALCSGKALLIDAGLP